VNRASRDRDRNSRGKGTGTHEKSQLPTAISTAHILLAVNEILQRGIVVVRDFSIMDVVKAALDGRAKDARIANPCEIVANV
jgi:hypothetical protein